MTLMTHSLHLFVFESFKFFNRNDTFHVKLLDQQQYNEKIKTVFYCRALFAISFNFRAWSRSTESCWCDSYSYIQLYLVFIILVSIMLNASVKFISAVIKHRVAKGVDFHVNNWPTQIFIGSTSLLFKDINFSLVSKELWLVSN